MPIAMGCFTASVLIRVFLISLVPHLMSEHCLAWIEMSHTMHLSSPSRD